jgi:iron complex outermembrane receptor protein
MPALVIASRRPSDRPIELQVNATNLFDVKYVSTMGTNGFGFSGDAQTLMVGAPRAVFGTIKAGF